MYLAEGSDWFWWYGSDQDSGQDEYFDEGFRALLRGVYESLGEPVPAFVSVPIIQAKPVAATRPMSGMTTPTIDGVVGAEEWTNAAIYEVEGGKPLAGLDIALDGKTLYFKIEAASGERLPTRLGIYLTVHVSRTPILHPNGGGRNADFAGYCATHAFVWEGGRDLAFYTASAKGWQSAGQGGTAAAKDGVLEVAIPLTALGAVEAGDDLRLVVVAQPESQVLPVGGPAQVVLPDLGLSTVILDIEDPEGDDHGPALIPIPPTASSKKRPLTLKPSVFPMTKTISSSALPSTVRFPILGVHRTIWRFRRWMFM